MYYVKFNEQGIQEEIKWSEETISDLEWHSIGATVDGKFYKLTSTGKATAMSSAQFETYMSGLAKESTLSFARRERDRLLTESDWTQLPTSNLSESKKVEWESYRQNLRDIPANIGEDLDFAFPQPPQ